jgi:hypothetical protein
MDAWMSMLPPAVAQFVDTNIFFKELGNFSAKNMQIQVPVFLVR